MIPWPIALLTLFYGAVAAASAAMTWKIASGAVEQPVIWALAWLALSAGAMLGLPLLKAWGRRLAVFGSWLMTALALSLAALLVLNGRPGGALLSTLGAGVHILILRYLGRPAVKALFA